MPADTLSSEEIERIRDWWIADLERDPQAIRRTIATTDLRLFLDEPTRLAAARAEGYREGVEAARRWHDEAAERIRCDADPLSTRRLDAIGDHEEAATAIRGLGGHNG